jgi:flagellar biosynthesis protein FliR
MEAVLSQLPAVLTSVWWPFCRVMAMLTAAPILGENMVPVSVRVLLSLVLAVILIPLAQPAVPIEPISAQAVLVTLEQVLIGFGIGFAFHLMVAVVMVLGFTVSSQMGLSMAVMNDPMNGNSSDAVSSVLYLLSVLVFFSIDGHLVLAGVMGASFHSYPVGTGIDLGTLQALVYHTAWVFSAALLLAVPVIFSALVVQLGFGFLNRAAPALNLYSLGFSVVTLFGLSMLGYVLRFVPDHYLRMTNQVLELLHRNIR